MANKVYGLLATLSLLALLAWGLHRLGSQELKQAGVDRSLAPRHPDGGSAVRNPALVTGALHPSELGRLDSIARNLVFRTDHSGQLLMEPEVIERLGALLDSEHSDHDARVPEQVAIAGLDEARAAQALGVLTRLRALRNDERALFTKPGRVEGLEGAVQMLAAQSALRRQHFGADAERLFADEEARMARQIQELGSAH